MKEDQKNIFYACGETKDKINLLPQVEQVKNKKYDVLYFTEYVDEFAIKALGTYDGKEFMNVADSKLDLDSEEDKEQITKLNEESKDILSTMKDALPEVKSIRYTNKLTSSPVCLTTEGELSIEMEKVINRMPGTEKITAEHILEINKNHPIVKKLENLYDTDKEELKKYAKVLYAEARLIEGLQVDNPVQISNIIVDLMSK
jgi:molecular chaperone HtpG